MPDPARKSVPRVSVCIPTIDRPAFLREAIRSVVDQPWRDLQIVIADNSANAEVQRRIDGVLAEFPGVEFVVKRHERQVEAAENFNSLIDAAEGEFWVCLPDDDRMCPRFLTRAIEALDAHPECAFTFADHWVMRSDGTLDDAASRLNTLTYDRHLLREGVYPYEQLFGIALRPSICLQTATFRRTTIAALRFTPGNMLLDVHLFLRLAASPARYGGYYIDERVFEYRVHPLQTTTIERREVMLRDHIAVFESVRDVPREHVRELKQKLGREYLALAMIEAETGAHREARAHAAKSLSLAATPRNALGALLVAAAPGAVSLARRVRGKLARARLPTS